MRFRTFVGGLAIVVIGLVVAPASSQATTLLDLFSGDSITIDEGGGVSKVFNNFVLSGSGGTNLLNPADISVSISPNPPTGEVGLLFTISSGGEFGAELGAGITADLGFSFEVHCIGCLLHDNTLLISGSSSGDGLVILSEQVLDLTTLGNLANKLVFFTSDLSFPLDHQVFSSDSTDIIIFKGLSIDGGTGDSSLAFVSDFSQTFSQTAVPGPATLLLIGAGLVAVGVIGRKRRNR